jgi:hypothetical protein
MLLLKSPMLPLLLKRQASVMKKRFYPLHLKRYLEEKKVKRILILLILTMPFNTRRSWSKKEERLHISTSSLISMQMSKYKKSYLSSATISSLLRISGLKRILQLHSTPQIIMQRSFLKQLINSISSRCSFNSSSRSNCRSNFLVLPSLH